jgi:hypothetical protein
MYLALTIPSRPPLKTGPIQTDLAISAAVVDERRGLQLESAQVRHPGRQLHEGVVAFDDLRHDRSQPLLCFFYRTLVPRFFAERARTRVRVLILSLRGVASDHSISLMWPLR